MLIILFFFVALDLQRLLKAAGVFAGSALLMYNFGHMMTPEGFAEVLS
jgi:hypothetical protein